MLFIRIRHALHEWRMRRKIRAILRYNRKHPEECFNLEDYVGQKLPLWPNSEELPVLAEDVHMLIGRMHNGTLSGRDEYEEALAEIEKIRDILTQYKIFVDARIEMKFKIPENYEQWKREQV